MIRDAANPGTDLGLRNAGNMVVSGNTFHDDGATYSGGKLGDGENPTPIPNLGL